MSIRWDPVLARAVAAELQRELSGARLRAVRLDGVERDLVLLFRDRTLLWRLHPTRGFPLLFPSREPAPGDIPLACTVKDVGSPPDERIVVMALAPVRGRRRKVRLVVELMGNQWNALVTEDDEARITHVLHRRSGVRPLVVGARYEPPPPSGRRGAEGHLSEEAWDRLVEEARAGSGASALVRSVAWVSPVNAPGLLHPDGGHALWTRLASGPCSEPVLLDLPSGVQPYPLALPGAPARAAPSLLAAFRDAAQASPTGPSAAALIPPHLLGALRRRVNVSRKRRRHLLAQWNGLDDATALRRTGALILARYAEIPRGAERVTLRDFDGTPVEVELDPSLPPHGNADGCYRRAARADRARARLPGLLEAAGHEVEALEGLLARAGEGEATVDELRAAVPEARGAWRVKPLPGQPTSLPYRTFRSSGGLEIRVGRGARQNDDLTFRHSAPDDIWLHARHAAGAHVILRWARSGSPPARDLEDAAVVAAVHSRARTSATAVVDWTRRKYVRKPRGSAPGSVVPDRVKTLFVEPDESRADALRDPDPWLP